MNSLKSIWHVIFVCVELTEERRMVLAQGRDQTFIAFSTSVRKVGKLDNFTHENPRFTGGRNTYHEKLLVNISKSTGRRQRPGVEWDNIACLSTLTLPA
jgi:hypothetical protein